MPAQDPAVTAVGEVYHGLLPGLFLLSYSVFVFIFPLIFSFPGRALD